MKGGSFVGTLLASCAIAFSTYSRLPMPQVAWSERNMRYTLAFFPLVGAAVGLVFWGADALCGLLGTGTILRAALRTAVLKRSYAYSGAEGLDAASAALTERISALAASADPGTARVTAPRAGLFSSLVDGYESVLNRENILRLTPSSYRAITPEAGAAGVGRLVYGTGWSFVTMMREEDVGRMQPGDTLTLRFQKGLDRDMAMEVAYVSAEEDGRRVVVLASERYLQLTTLLRLQNAQIIFESYDGIRVPRSAVRVNAQPLTDEDGKPLLDSSGNPITQNLTCVYCLWGEKARSKPVKVLWQEDEYILVAPDEEALGKYTSEQTKESRRLRAGDEVITAAADLYDGKVIR